MPMLQRQRAARLRREEVGDEDSSLRKLHMKNHLMNKAFLGHLSVKTTSTSSKFRVSFLNFRWPARHVHSSPGAAQTQQRSFSRPPPPFLQKLSISRNLPFFFEGMDPATPFFTLTPPFDTRTPPPSYSDTPGGNIDFFYQPFKFNCLVVAPLVSYIAFYRRHPRCRSIWPKTWGWLVAHFSFPFKQAYKHLFKYRIEDFSSPK